MKKEENNEEENPEITDMTEGATTNDNDIEFEESNEEGSRSGGRRKDAKPTGEGPLQSEDDGVSFEDVNEDGEQDVRATLKKLREKIKKLESEKKEYLELSQRARADYMNLKKETEADRVTTRMFANKKLIEELLPVLDAYDMAQANQEAWEKVDKNWRVGIEYIFGQLRTVLEREGVTQFGNIGDAFDPTFHESMEHIPVTNEKENDTIVQILQKGYKMGSTILRPARVKTGEYKK